MNLMNENKKLTCTKLTQVNSFNKLMINIRFDFN